MAPLKGFTDHIFRTLFTEHFGGFDLGVAPFISTKKDARFKKKHVKDLWPENNTRLPVVPQIMSNSSLDFIALTEFITDMGYERVNWNLGCPFPMVAGKGRGAGMLPHTERIASFLEEVVPKIKCRLSIKLRLGWETSADIFRLMPVLDRFPLEELMIHARTGIQRYDGNVDLAGFENCLLSTHHKIVYNGDIRTVTDFESLTRRFPEVHGWMIGRGCIYNPFLPGRIRGSGPAMINGISKMKKFHDDLFQAYSEVLEGPSHVIGRMKGFWQYFSHDLTGLEKEIKMVKKAIRHDQYVERVDQMFAAMDPSVHFYFPGEP